MDINNFNESNTGVNIELDIYRDIDSAHSRFDECFERYDFNERYFSYTSYGERDVIDVFDLNNYTCSKKDLQNLLLSDSKLEHIKEELKNNLGKYWGTATIDDLKEVVYLTLLYCVQECGEYEFSKLCKHLKPKFDITEVTGYSQGDSSYVISDKSYKIDNDYLCNLFYDEPFYISLTVNGEGVCLYDYLKSEYDYNKEEIIQAFKDNYKDIVGYNETVLFLSDNLPESV